MADLEDLVARLQFVVNKASQELGPTDDLNPMLAVVAEDEVRYRVIDPELFSSSNRDRMYGEALPKLLRQLDPDLAAMILQLRYFEVTDLNSDDNWDKFKGALNNELVIPETKEGILIAAYSRDEESLWVSEVIRFPDEPPLLGMWTPLPEHIYSETIDSLRKGMHDS